MSSGGGEMSSHADTKPWTRWTLTLMRYPPSVTVEAQSFEDAVAEARSQLEAWVPTARWSGYATGSGAAVVEE